MCFALMNDSTEIFFFVVAFTKNIYRGSSGIEARYRELKIEIDHRKDYFNLRFTHHRAHGHLVIIGKPRENKNFLSI